MQALLPSALLRVLLSALQLDYANILPDDEQLRLEQDLKELEQ